ncbi:hypothetical protein POTOM_051916 [Populus tomentosa]|uniref:Mitochondrial import inner membrane translocase subunit TIM50 n=1 Tax=Populus tomentosa TaxID=118781 RepID=A0A8X8C8U2_POPTO|nr:hypothetical protein POTOM_051916 [Populus tomentosa]
MLIQAQELEECSLNCTILFFVWYKVLLWKSGLFVSRNLPLVCIAYLARAISFVNAVYSVNTEKDVEGKPEINHVTVFERPGLKEFLKQIGEFADLILFTAGIEGYASPLFDRIDVENRFSQRLFRPSTVSTIDWQNGVFSKVSAVTLLVTETSWNLGLDEMDCKFVLFLPLFIERFIEPWATHEGISRTCEGSVVFIKNPSLQKDVRPVLHKRFHMLEWFQMHGIPASALTV